MFGPGEYRAKVVNYASIIFSAELGDAGIKFLNTADDGVTTSTFSTGLSTSTYDTRVRGLVAMLMGQQRFQEQ